MHSPCITLLPWKFFSFFSPYCSPSLPFLSCCHCFFTFSTFKKMCLFQQAAKWHFFSWLNLAVLCTLFFFNCNDAFFFFWGSCSTLELSWPSEWCETGHYSSFVHASNGRVILLAPRFLFLSLKIESIRFSQTLRIGILRVPKAISLKHKRKITSDLYFKFPISVMQFYVNSCTVQVVHCNVFYSCSCLGLSFVVAGNADFPS